MGMGRDVDVEGMGMGRDGRGWEGMGRLVG